MKHTNYQKLWAIVLTAGEGTRVRDFLVQRCGGRGIKQFCAVLGRRSMIEHTLARVERLIPPQRILIVVSPGHREEVTQQLAHWPADNVIFQPANRGTAPGILLSLASRLRVPAVGWSDWGSVERICASLELLSNRSAGLAQLRHRGSDAVLAVPLMEYRRPGMRPSCANDWAGRRVVDS